MFYSEQCVDGSSYWSLEQIQAQGNGCLFAAIKALSSIDMAKTWTLSNASGFILTSYLSAIQLLNEALASPSEASKDSTLLATLILSNIEMKAAPNQDSSYWQAHAIGAVALLRLRGATQVTSTVGAALYFQASGLILTSCMLARRPVPAELLELRHVVRSFLNDEAHPVWRHQGAIIRLTNFIAQISEGNVGDHVNAVTEAYDIYEELLSVFSSAGLTWQYENIRSQRYLGLLDYEHEYHSVLATQLWNSHRAAIILLCTTIACLGVKDTDEDRLIGRARSFRDSVPHIVNQNAIETLAAVPRAVDRIDSRQRHLQLPADRTDICHTGHSHHLPVFQTTTTEEGVVPYLHSCQIQWAVFFGVQCSLVAVEIRRRLWTVLEEAGQR